jgi:uncharacterized repeat protein (TIGR02543 family)
MRFASIAAAGYQSFAIDEDGGLWAWGMSHGVTPARIKPDTRFISVSAGGYDASDSFSAIDEDGGLWDKREFYFGGSLVKIKDGTQFSSVATGKTHRLAIDTDGGLWAWGSNYFGERGDSSNHEASISVPVRIKPDTLFISVAAGGEHSLAVDADGGLWAWGANNFSQLGVGYRSEIDDRHPTPIKISDYSGFTSVAAAGCMQYPQSMALDKDGGLWRLNFTPGRDWWPVRTYTVTVISEGAEGAGAISQTPVISGRIISINAGTRAGFTFSSWTMGNGGNDFMLENRFSPQTTFIMPPNDVTVTANWREIPTYTVTIAGGGAGHGVTPAAPALPGETITLNAGTRDGFIFIGWTVNSHNAGIRLADRLSAQTTFVMPGGNVTVTANWTEIPTGDSDRFVISLRPMEGTPAVLKQGGTLTMLVLLETPLGKNAGSITDLNIAFDSNVLEWELRDTGRPFDWRSNSPFEIWHGDILSFHAPRSLPVNNANLGFDFFEPFYGVSVLGFITLRVKLNAPADSPVNFTMSVSDMAAHDGTGYDTDTDIVLVTPGTLTTFTPLHGDISGNGHITSNDVTMLRRYIAAQNKTAFMAANPKFNLHNADVNGDGVIDASDVTLLRKFVASGGCPSIRLGPQQK